MVLLRARPTTLDDFMDYLVMHTKQIEEKKAVIAASVQVCLHVMGIRLSIHLHSMYLEYLFTFVLGL